MPTASLLSSASSDRIRRRRVTTACILCRERRIKCDRTHPTCAQCKKGEKNCKYVDQDRSKVDFINEPPNPVERSERGLAPHFSDTWGSVIENQAALVKKSDHGKDGVPIWAVAEAEEPSRPQILQAHESVSRPYVIPVGALGEKFVFALTNHFPSRQACQTFFENFFLGVHPIVPVCHIPTLRKEYENFWTNISPLYSVESLALILAVLYTGAANPTQVDVSNSSTFLRLYEEIFCKVDFTSYNARNKSASIQLLQGYTIMNTHKASYLVPFSAFGFLPQVIRFAQSLRLYAEKKDGSPIELEVQRRIWWHLLFLDVEATVATGLPPIIHRTGYTTQLPSIFNHENIESAVDPIPEPKNFSPMMIAMQGHYLCAQRMQTWFETLPSKSEVSDFKALIESFVNLMPQNKDLENEWARTYLKMQIDRAYCMLGLRFWQLDQYKDTACDSEVIETSRSFLSYYLRLSTFPQSSQFSWFVPGLIQPLHALIILLMHLSTCHDIENEENRSRCLLDNVMSLRVDHISNGKVVLMKSLLCGDDRPQRANPRYLILVELRKRVWNKLGWDKDGKGIDPWSRRTAHGEVVASGDEEAKGGMTSNANETEKTSGNNMIMDAWNEGWPIEESTGLEDLDNILVGDPMDLIQWEEWETLTSDFFAS